MYLRLQGMREQRGLSVHRGSELLVQDILQQMRLSEVLDRDEPLRGWRSRHVRLRMRGLVFRKSFQVPTGRNLPKDSHAMPDDTLQNLQLPQ